MKGGAIIRNAFTKSALIGAALAVPCGLLLWGTTPGEPWVNSSYDYIFRFGERPVTNQVVLVLMDDESYEQLHQKRRVPWDRALHTRLLNKLTGAKSSLVVFDVWFKSNINAETGSALAKAIRQNGKVVLMATIHGSELPGVSNASVLRPEEIVFNAAAGCGIGQADTNTGPIVRRHWPFLAPGEGEFHSLGWVAAETFLHTNFGTNIEKQWLRYYGEKGPWEPKPYYLALSNASEFFSNKVVFIGNSPEKGATNDIFPTPYTRWNGKAVGGMEIMATTFLNLVNGDWLRRPPAWLEAALLTLTGILIGGGLCHLKPLTAGLVAAGISLIVMLAFVSWSYFTNYWFPWLVIAGGQVPCALAWAWCASISRPRPNPFPVRFPGYVTVGEPFGKGAYGKVWLVRDVTGHLQALKEVELSKFDDESPYEREFHGIKSYKPFSNQHPGLLHIDHVNRNDPDGYFYYVMELGDALDPDWQQKGEPYEPRDLAKVCQQSESKRLSARECIRIGIELLEPLDFLHQQKRVHRDIKPSNIIFVKGRPKFADVGLVREIPEPNEDPTIIGTEFYMPPRTEELGTESADIYGMGKVLYVISTGKTVKFFSELSTTLVEKPDFMWLNEIICKACQPHSDQRYASAAEMLAALREAQTELDRGQTKRI